MLAEGTPYMVLEFLRGEDLSRTLSTRGALPVSEAIGHVLQASEAIAEAHRMGIIHRDLKPANLFLATAEDGTRTIKVLDFGISKLLEDDDRRSFAVLTRSHELLGTPSFMAPEQLRSARDVDARADVWSMGVILYQLLTAKLPFGKQSLHERLMMVARGEPPPRPRHHRPDLPLAVDAAITRCLEYDRERRFAGVSDFAAAITPYRSGLWTEATADTPPPSTPSTPATLVTPATLPSNRDAPTVNELPPARSPGVSSRQLILLGVLLACAVALFGAAIRVVWRMRDRSSPAPRSAGHAHLPGISGPPPAPRAGACPVPFRARSSDPSHTT